MQTISGIEEKTKQLKDFFAGDCNTDCLVIISEDETEDIEIINNVARDLGHVDYNVILCFGCNAPIFIVPAAGIACKSRVILLVDGVPDAWTTRENVVRFMAPDTEPVTNTLVNVIRSDP